VRDDVKKTSFSFRKKKEKEESLVKKKRKTDVKPSQLWCLLGLMKEHTI
jgi:hypothetical protein